MNQRSQAILEAVVGDFIETGRPVSSGHLYSRYRFDVRPATIRAELGDLTDAGFLSQPHTSGGRVPTNRGYQFFVDHLIEKRLNTDSYFVKTGDWFNKIGDFVDEISGELRLLGIVYQPTDREVYKSGLDELIAALDFETKKEIFDVVSDFERMDERIEEILDYLDGSGPKVFIGRSPITKSQNLSVIADLYRPKNRNVILVAVGPKRMDYQKTIQFFKILHEQ